MKNILILLSLGIFLLSSCKKDETNISKTKNYIHLSHTRTDINPFMDEKINDIDFENYDMLWLGGDLAQLTSLDDETMDYVDSVYDLGSPNTLWALGNHDYTDLDRIEQYTERAPYYTYHRNGITFLVLDTQDSLSNIIGAQKEMVTNILDTIQHSSHLVILHHKLIWMENHPLLEPMISTVSNGDLGDCFYCINPNNFNTEIYPKLVEVKQKGIEVICIGGDIGFRTNQFEYKTDDGIHFLASGIHSNVANDNKVLVFFHDLKNKYLSWEYQGLELL